MSTILDLIPDSRNERFKPEPPGISYYLGLDLGQRRDHSALAIIERRVTPDSFDHATWQHITKAVLELRHISRLPLDTPYTEVAHQVCARIGRAPLTGNSQLAIDATGVGLPVVEHIKQLRPPCRLLPVIITGPGAPHSNNGTWFIPKRDLIANLQVLVEMREIGIASRHRQSNLLAAELLNFGSGKEHDDLVIATALAAWFAGRRRRSG